MRFFLLLILIASFQSAPAHAGYQDGWDALKRQNWREALNQWEPLAAAGDARALYALGWLYHTSGPPLRDYAKAKRYYEDAANRRHVKATLALGLLHQDGLGVRPDTIKALDYMVRAEQFAEAATGAGDKDVEYAIAQIYVKGQGVPRDYGLALEWHEKAARHNHPASQYFLGTVHETGWGVEVDRPLAYYWYSLANRHSPSTLSSFTPEADAKAALAKLESAMSEIEIARARKMLQAKGLTPRR
ncbi:MAG: hypothetical protein A2516_00945 [Alphaproteobacteria bacterium RIFOXYD12_FULL_60_8]|nr:MAG: hypothetical protein A2516_00945 [Alphaproteobacteria bacterium RIFOXYD12_FULL_60_8]